MSRSARSFMSMTRAPADAARVEPELVAPVEWLSSSAASRLCAEVIGVEVAGEVQVDVLHRHDLGVAAAGGAALHPEARARGWARAGRSRRAADAGERVAEADGGRRLALARRRRGDRGDQHQLAVGRGLRARRGIRARAWPWSGRSGTARRPESQLGADRFDRRQARRLGDLDVALSNSCCPLLSCGPRAKVFTVRPDFDAKRKDCRGPVSDIPSGASRTSTRRVRANTGGLKILLTRR